MNETSVDFQCGTLTLHLRKNASYNVQCSMGKKLHRIKEAYTISINFTYNSPTRLSISPVKQ